MNKSNEELVEEIKQFLEIYRVKPNSTGTSGDKIEADFDRFSIRLLAGMFKALTLKDSQAVLAVEIATRNMKEACKEEKIKLVERVPVSLTYAGMIQWKEDEIEKLNQLQNETNQ